MSNTYVTKIPDLQYFQGDTVTITFGFFYNDQTPIDLLDAGAEVKWNLCPYGNYNYPIMSKNCVISDRDHHIATVHLSVEDTRQIDDIKCSHQPIVVYKDTTSTREYIRAEGDIIFKPRIKYDLIV